MGSLVMVHDGSFMPDKDEDVCATAFCIYCINTINRYKGAAAEYLKEADNYWAEIQGRTLVNLILRAASQHRSSPYRTENIECDSAGAVSHGNASKRGLEEKKVQADALCSFKQLVSDHPFKVQYN